MQDKDRRDWMIKRRKKYHKKAKESEVIYTGMFQMMVFENEENISFLIELNDEILQSSDEESGLGFLHDVTAVRYFVISFFKQKKKKKNELKFVLYKAYKFCLIFWISK